MAAGAWLAYDNGLLKILDGTIDLTVASTCRMVLITSSYTPSLSDTAWNAATLSTNEVVGTGYTANGKVLTMSITDVGAGIIQIDCDDQSWTGSTITAKYAVIMHDANQDGTIATTDVPLFYCDLNDGGGSVSSTAANFDININANGIYRITAAQS